MLPFHGALLECAAAHSFTFCFQRSLFMPQTSLVRLLPWRLTSSTSCQAFTLPLGKHSLLLRVWCESVLRLDGDVNKNNVYLCVRRLNLADIERIAPLEEGCLPYHLAELQKQVAQSVHELSSNYFALPYTCSRTICLLENYFQRYNRKAEVTKVYSIRATAMVPGPCGSKWQSRPTGSPWAPLLEVRYPGKEITSFCPLWGIVLTLDLAHVWLHSYGSNSGVPHRSGEDPNAESEIHWILRWRADV